MSGSSNGKSNGIGTTATGTTGGAGGSKKKGAAGAGNSTARSRSSKAAAGKVEGEADAASLVRTLALSNFGDRPVFLEVNVCRHRSGLFQFPREPTYVAPGICSLACAFLGARLRGNGSRPPTPT